MKLKLIKDYSTWKAGEILDVNVSCVSKDFYVINEGMELWPDGRLRSAVLVDKNIAVLIP